MSKPKPHWPQTAAATPVAPPKLVNGVNGANGTNGHHANHDAPPPALAAADILEKTKDLIRLAREQGNLTHGDISEAFGDGALSPEQLEEVHSKLRT